MTRTPTRGTKFREAAVGFAGRLGERSDRAVARWKRRTSHRRRTLYLAVFLVIWFGSGAWVMHTWLSEGATPGRTEATTADAATDVGGASAEEGGRAAAHDEAPFETRLARWAEQHRDGWTTVDVHPDESREGRWLILGRTDRTPQNRVAALTVDVGADGAIRLVDEQLP